MPDISKHLFIMFYIVGFFIGIILLTLNQIYISKTHNECYGKLQYFNWSFFGHIAINFIYFYGLYFYISWEVKDFILFLVNACFTAFIFFSIQMMQSFGGYRIPKGRPLLIAAGVFYIVAYTLSYKAVENEAHHIHLKLSLIIFIMSELFLIGVVLVCCLKLLIHWAGNNNEDGSRLLIPVFSFGTIAYTLFNAYVDICFYFFDDRTLIWGINIYNLTALYYIVLNLVSIPLIYHQKNFLKPLLEKVDAPSLSEGVKIDLLPATLSDSAEKYHLSARETEVLNLICRGKSNPDISITLFISNNTVKHHVNSIFKKTGVKNRYELLSILKNQHLS